MDLNHEDCRQQIHEMISMTSYFDNINLHLPDNEGERRIQTQAARIRFELANMNIIVNNL